VPGKDGKRERVNIEDALGKGGYEEGGEKGAYSHEADEVNFVFVGVRRRPAVVGFAFEPLEGMAREGMLRARRVRGRGAGLVANYDGDFGVRDRGRRRHYRRGLRSWSRDAFRRTPMRLAMKKKLNTPAQEPNSVISNQKEEEGT